MAARIIRLVGNAARAQKLQVVNNEAPAAAAMRPTATGLGMVPVRKADPVILEVKVVDNASALPKFDWPGLAL